VADGKLHLVLNNTLAGIEDGRCRMLDFLGTLDERASHRLQVIFEEIVSNTVRHGFTRGSGQSIHVVIERQAGAIALSFEDDGAPFDPSSAPAPEAFSSIESARVGGLGIPLVQRLAKTLQYERLAPQTGSAGFKPCNRVLVSVAA
jgi:serine/threonine-protein kinase RsbW